MMLNCKNENTAILYSIVLIYLFYYVPLSIENILFAVVIRYYTLI